MKVYGLKDGTWLWEDEMEDSWDRITHEAEADRMEDGWDATRAGRALEAQGWQMAEIVIRANG